MEKEIRELRLDVDRLINSVHALNTSREVSLCHTQLQRAKSWLGMVLGELGTETPYPSSSDPTSPVIEPQAEHLDWNQGWTTIWNQPAESNMVLADTQLAYVKFFRKKIEEYQKKFFFISAEAYPYLASSARGMHYLTKSEDAMTEAKHWLGWELNRIFNQQKFDESVKNGTVGSAPGKEPMPLY